MPDGSPDAAQDLVDDVARALRAGKVHDKGGLQRLKQNLVRAHGAKRMPRDSELIARLPPDLAADWLPVLRKKPMRTGSGVAVVAVMSSPAACPHGKCVYCPGGPEVDAPQSYTGFEPSTMRAKRFDYDPYRIVRSRLGQLAANGHTVDKVDVVIQGGTFPARDKLYRDWFVAGIYAGCNDGPGSGDEDRFVPFDIWSTWDETSREACLDSALRRNEEARCRVIGLTIETKPDWCLEPHLDEMLRYGATRIELGVQTLDEEVTHLTHRGHTMDDTRRALRLARDAGFKMCAHMMPGLPRPTATPGHYATDAAADIEDMRRLFAESDWRPDMLKIYPTLVVMEGETPLKRWWQEGRYTPLDTAAATDVVAASLAFVPEWCRIQRIDRDIPTTHIEAGVMNSNLRQLAEAEAARRGHPVRDIRAREVHRREQEGIHVDPARIVLVRRDYDAARGTECFLSLEDPQADAIVAFLRLRRTATPHRDELVDAGGSAVVRELKVYGMAQALGQHDDPEAGAWQHQGHGARLLAEAERIAREEWSVGRLLVLAGPGVKAYYRRAGYSDVGPYVAKVWT